MLLKLLIKLLKNKDDHIFLIIIDYLIEENRILKAKFESTSKRLLLNHEERRSLAKLGNPLIKHGVKKYINIVIFINSFLLRKKEKLFQN